MRPRRALALAPLAALPLLAPVPALAQGPGPTATGEPRPTQTPHRDYTCPVVDLEARPTTARVGELVTVTARRQGGDPDRPVTVSLHRLRPGPEAVVRQDSSTSTVTTWTVRLGETHLLRGRATPNTDQCFSLGRPEQAPVTVSVAPALSISAVRTGVRDYVFSGRVLPGRGQAVNLYRVEADGRRVLTSRGTVAADGTYRIERRFTGSGRFGFVVTVPTSDTNLAGESRVRPTVIH